MNKEAKVHPVVNINYVLRTVAATSFLIISYSALGEQLFTLKYFWLIPIGLFWSHLARFISTKAQNGKQQEIFNMHLDAFVSAIICVTVPSFLMITIVTTIILSNALFVGFYRLFIHSIIILTATIAVGLSITGHTDLFDITHETTYVIGLSFATYFFVLGSMGHKLIRHMLDLNKKVKILSITDPLTQCYNRLYLDENITKELQRCQRLNYPLTVIFADIDHFKTINDNFGHSIGDKILIQFVNIAHNCIRNDVDWIARFGGEEFVFVLPNSNTENGVLIAERIRCHLNENPFSVANREINVSCSFGVASVDMSKYSIDAETLLNTADKGLYEAKANGRNRVEVVEAFASLNKEKPESLSA